MKVLFHALIEIVTQLNKNSPLIRAKEVTLSTYFSGMELFRPAYSQ